MFPSGSSILLITLSADGEEKIWIKAIQLRLRKLCCQADLFKAAHEEVQSYKRECQINVTVSFFLLDDIDKIWEHNQELKEIMYNVRKRSHAYSRRTAFMNSTEKQM